MIPTESQMRGMRHRLGVGGRGEWAAGGRPTADRTKCHKGGVCREWGAYPPVRHAPGRSPPSSYTRTYSTSS